MRPTRRSTRTFSLLALTFTVGVLGSVATLNVLADPFKVWRPDSTEHWDIYKGMTLTRIVRAEQARRGHWQAALVGSSRTEIGFDPAHPALQGHTAVNLGLIGSRRKEIVEMARYTLTHNPGLKILMVELDPTGWWDKQDPGALEEYRQSRLNPDLKLWDYRLSNLLGGSTTERAVQTLGNVLKRKNKNPFTPLGLRVDDSMYTRHTAAQRFHLADYPMACPPQRPWERVFDPAGMDEVAALSALAQQRGVRLVWAIPPSHALRLVADLKNGGLRAVQDYKRAMVRMAAKVNASGQTPAVEVWDFLTLDEPNRETVPTDTRETRWHWEAGHFKKELGDLVLDAVFGHAPEPQFGTRLTADNVEAHLAGQRAALADYIRAHPELAPAALADWAAPASKQ